MYIKYSYRELSNTYIIHPDNDFHNLGPKVRYLQTTLSYDPIWRPH